MHCSWREVPALPNKKSPCSNEDPAQPKINTNFKKVKEPDPLEWTPDCHQVLLELKRFPTGVPTLASPDPSSCSIHMHVRACVHTHGRTHQGSAHTHTQGRTHQGRLPKPGASDSGCSLF